MTQKTSINNPVDGEASLGELIQESRELLKKMYGEPQFYTSSEELRDDVKQHLTNLNNVIFQSGFLE